MERTREELMLLAAWMYYEDELTHREISEKLHTSRVKITRLLKEAREKGIVQIKIVKPLPYHHEIAREMVKTFDLDEAIIVGTQGHIATEVGKAAAAHFHNIVKDGDIIGFGWSSTVRYMADYVKSTKTLRNCKIVELIGSMIGQGNPYSISGRIADALKTDIFPLAVPVIVHSATARSVMLQEHSIRDNLQMGCESDIAFAGIGDISLHSTLMKTGHITEDDIRWLQERGVVGDIFMRYFDINGYHVETPFDDRIIGLQWKDIANLRYLTIIAHGSQKVEPLLGILRSKIARCIVSDVATCELILKR